MADQKREVVLLQDLCWYDRRVAWFCSCAVWIGSFVHTVGEAIGANDAAGKAIGAIGSVGKAINTVGNAIGTVGKAMGTVGAISTVSAISTIGNSMLPIRRSPVGADTFLDSAASKRWSNCRWLSIRREKVMDDILDKKSF